MLKKTTKDKNQNLVEKEEISWEKNLIIICNRLDEISKLIKNQSGDLRKDETVNKTERDESFKSVFDYSEKESKKKATFYCQKDFSPKMLYHNFLFLKIVDYLRKKFTMTLLILILVQFNIVCL